METCLCLRYDETGDGMYNNLSNREIEILKILYQADSFVKCEKIAAQIGKSVKTIRNDIQNIRQLGAEYEFRILSRTHRGYRLEIDNYENFNYIISNYNDEINDYSVRKERIRFYEIACYLLMEKDPVEIDDLETEFFFSQSVLLNELNSVRYTMEHFSLRLSIDKGFVWIEGQEYHKRLLLSVLISTKRYYKSVYERLFDVAEGMEEVHAILMFMKQQLMCDEQLSYSDGILRILSFYLYLSRKRRELGAQETINISDFQLVEKQYPRECAFAETVLTESARRWGHIWEENEQQIFSILLISYVCPRIYASADCEEYIEFMVAGLCRMSGKELFRSDYMLREQLYAFFYAKEIRDRFRTYDVVLTPLRFRRRKTVAIEVAYTLYVSLCEKYKTPLIEREVISLSQCFQNLFAKIDRCDTATRIAVVSRFGLVESRRLSEMLQLNYMEFQGTFFPADSNELMNPTFLYDLLITDHKEKLSEKPTFFLDDYTQSNQIVNLFHFIREHTGHLSDFMNCVTHKVMCGLKLKTRDDVFIYIDRLYRQQTKGEQILTTLQQRDVWFPYEVGNRIALLCVRTKHITESVMHFLVLEKPILWYINYVNLIIVYFTNSDFMNLRYLGGSLSILMQNQEAINRFIKNPNLRVIQALEEKE